MSEFNFRCNPDTCYWRYSEWCPAPVQITHLHSVPDHIENGRVYVFHEIEFHDLKKLNRLHGSSIVVCNGRGEITSKLHNHIFNTFPAPVVTCRYHIKLLLPELSAVPDQYIEVNRDDIIESMLTVIGVQKSDVYFELCYNYLSIEPREQLHLDSDSDSSDSGSDSKDEAVNRIAGSEAAFGSEAASGDDESESDSVAGSEAASDSDSVSDDESESDSVADSDAVSDCNEIADIMMALQYQLELQVTPSPLLVIITENPDWYQDAITDITLHMSTSELIQIQLITGQHILSILTDILLESWKIHQNST